MIDRPEDSAETPMQRALRMKKAAQADRSRGPAAARFKPKPSAGVAAGVSKPQLKK